MKKKLTAIMGVLMLSIAMLPANAYAYWTTGFEVIVNGNSIGIAKNSEVVDFVLNSVNDELKVAYGESETISPDIQLRAKLVASEKLVDYDTLYNGIAAESDKMIPALRINVDGTDTIYVSNSNDMTKSLDLVVATLGVEGLKSEIIQIIGREETFAPKIQVLTYEDAAQYFIDNNIITVSSINTTHEESEYIAPDIEIPADDLFEGYKDVQSEAVPGKKIITTMVYYVNGEKTDERVFENIVDNGVPATVRIGTKERPINIGCGNFNYPVTNGTLTSGFGERWGRFHYGIDLAVPTGTSVHASDNGVVTFAGEKGSFGILVIIDHKNGYETYYAHNSELCVSEGDVVTQGDEIAKSGSTGRSTGPHCHFEVHIDGVAQDPLSYLD